METEEQLSGGSDGPRSLDNDYVKMSSQWVRRLDEVMEQNQQLRLSTEEMKKDKYELQQRLENVEHQAKTLEVERDQALKAQANHKRQLKTLIDEHSLEVEELQARISFLEKKMEATESGKELQERINYLEQELASRQTEVRLLQQKLFSAKKQSSSFDGQDEEIDMQQLLVEKTELERSLGDIRCDSVRKDREISRLSRSLEGMEKELDLMRNLIKSAPKPTPAAPRQPGHKRLSKRLSWFSERMGGPSHDKSATLSPHFEEQPTKMNIRRTKSVDALDLPPPPSSMKIRWHKNNMEKAPTNQIVRGAAVVYDDAIYFSSHLNSKIWGYNSIQNLWFSLADCPNVFFALAMVNGCLTSIGGQRSHRGVKPTNELLSLVEGTGDERFWVELNTPMPTKRINATAVTTDHVLIVAGGADTKKLDTVEIMTMATKQWSVAMSLPRPIESMSSAYCPTTDRVFLMGGDEDGGPMEAVLTCSVEKLLHSCARFNRIQDSSEVWEMISQLEVSYPTCLVVQDHLLALGGIQKDQTHDSRAVYDYDFNTKSWKLLTMIPRPAHKLLAATLPKNKLIVLGGFTKVNISDDIYFADIIFER